MRNSERLKKIYSKTDGYCHLCHRKLSLTNYNQQGTKGAWHIDHSKAKANGGTDHMNNLFPACIICNNEKGVLHKQTIRRRFGVSRAPLSKLQKNKIKKENSLIGMAGGSIVGSVFGPPGILIGAILGGLIGEDLSPKK